jgi:hypothetical protein
MVEAKNISETSLNFYQISRHKNPEDGHVHGLRVFWNKILKEMF